MKVRRGETFHLDAKPLPGIVVESSKNPSGSTSRARTGKRRKCLNLSTGLKWTPTS